MNLWAADRRICAGEVKHLEGLRGWLLRLGERTHFGGKQCFWLGCRSVSPEHVQAYPRHGVEIFKKL
jgi:hypothetical protein